MKTLRILLTSAAVLGMAVSVLAAENELTEAEQRDGWRLLFDGQSTRGWMSIEGKSLPATHVQDGALNPHPCHYMLVYGEPLENFILSLDFKISPRCNSGLFLRTHSLTPRPGRDVGFNGIEIAIDDTSSAGFHDTGAFYDLVKPRRNAMKPAGQWNRMLVTSNGDRLAVELNGEPVNQMTLSEWTEVLRRPDGSAHKFDVVYAQHPRKGYVGLQDHGSDCWYRNIKLKLLP